MFLIKLTLASFHWACIVWTWRHLEQLWQYIFSFISKAEGIAIICTYELILTRNIKPNKESAFFIALIKSPLINWNLMSENCIRVQAIQERLRVVKENATFEIAALFQSPHTRVKKRGNFKSCIFFDYLESFLYCLYFKMKKERLKGWIKSVWNFVKMEVKSFFLDDVLSQYLVLYPRIISSYIFIHTFFKNFCLAILKNSRLKPYRDIYNSNCILKVRLELAKFFSDFCQKYCSLPKRKTLMYFFCNILIAFFNY